MNPDRPILSLEELDAFDRYAPQGVRRRFCCPLCGQGKPRDGAHRCLSVESATGLWKCFRCEASGQLREQWQEKPRQSRARTHRALGQAFGIGRASTLSAPLPISIGGKASSPLALPEPPAPLPPAPPNALSAALRGLQPLGGSRGEIYLQKRGLPLEVCQSAKVKWSPSWLGRPAVVFPIYDDMGTVVAAQGRYADGREDPKARTLGNKKSGVFLTGGFWEQVRKGAPIIITEAPIDALSLAACGFPALALCGKSGWPQWLPIKCAFKEVVLAFDGDTAGEEGAAKLSPILESLGARVRRVAPEGAKDWNEMLARRGAHKTEEWLCARLLCA